VWGQRPPHIIMMFARAGSCANCGAGQVNLSATHTRHHTAIDTVGNYDCMETLDDSKV